MIRSAIPKNFFLSVKDDDPYRASKIFQIEQWCYSNWRLHQRAGKRGCSFIAKVLSSEDCWIKVDNIHGVKLDRPMVGRKLIGPDSIYDQDRKYSIACRYCLEEEIITLFEERKKSLTAQGKKSLLEYEHLVRCYRFDLLEQFWSHFISGYISKLNLNGRHPYKYGLDCAVYLHQEQAVQFFWNKIKSLPEIEISQQEKDEMMMNTAVYTAGNRNCYPEIFEYCFTQIAPDRYPELLNRDLSENHRYNSLGTLQSACRFDLYQRLFDCLKPSNISENEYYIWLKYIKIDSGSSNYSNEAKKVFMHMWEREGFDSHREHVIKRELCIKSCFLVTSLLIPWVHHDYLEILWAVLDKANSNQIIEFMDTRQAEYIRSVLRKRNADTLKKFLAYSKTAEETAAP